jgi:hypothetical protein
MPAPRPAARTGRASLRPVPNPTTNPAGQPAVPAPAQPTTHGPYSTPPRSRAILPAERTQMLADALRGVRLGAFDRRSIQWLCRWVDTPNFLALLGILQRARQATPHLAQPPPTSPAESAPEPVAGEQGTRHSRARLATRRSSP